MPCACKATNLGNPDTVKFRIGRNAVIVVVGHLTIFIMFGIKAHVALAVLQGIFGINPTRSSPVARKGRARRDVDDIKQRARVIHGIRTRIAHIFCGRVYGIDRIARTLGVIVEAVVKVVVELFKIAYERTVFVRFLVFIEFKGKELATHAVLDIRNFALHHVRHQVVVLAGLHGKALVRSKAARVSQLRICLLVQDCFCIESFILTNALATDERARTAQSLLAVGSQVLVVRKANIVAAVRHIEFFKVRRIRHVSVEHVTFLVSHFARQSRAFEPSLVTFDNVALDRCIPVIVCRVIETEITHVVTLFLVTAELRSQKARLTSTLQGGNNHREHCHRHIGNVQYHGARGNRLLGLYHHAPSVEIEVLVSGIVTSTEVATRNLNSLVREPSDFHAVQLLVILICRCVIDFTDTTFHVVLEPHTRKRWILGFAQHRIARRRQDAVFLIKQNRIGIQSCRTILELGTVIQVKGRFIDIVNQVHGAVFNGIYTGRVVHPVNLCRILFFLNTLFEFKASHLLAEGGRSGDGKNP